MRIRIALLAAVLPALATAEEPLSVIDWLTQPSGLAGAGRVLMEPPVTKTALRPDVSVAPLEAVAPPLGLVSPQITGLPSDLWLGSDAAVLARALTEVPVARRPAMQTLLYTLLLAEAVPPSGDHATQSLLMARVNRLMALGAVDPAQALLEQAGPSDNGALFSRWFDATLLTGDEEASCIALNAAPHLSPGHGARIFCGVRAGAWANAALLFETSRVLGLMSPEKTAVLDRFLNPDLYDGADPLPAPSDPNPLMFRLYESIGEPLATATLPRAYATADLRDLAGWKSQLEAAERLARTGALPPNQLLGLYDARLPAASGGVWDRVEALQRFETALRTRNPDAVAKTLPTVWTAMQEAQLEVPFAVLFADQLSTQKLTDQEAATLAWQIALLSQDYEQAALNLPNEMPATLFLAGLAQGAPAGGTTAMQEAIEAGFAEQPKLSAEQQLMITRHRLGEVVLEAMQQFDDGARGNLNALTAALTTLRAVGLEDTARQASLQLLLLDRA